MSAQDWAWVAGAVVYVAIVAWLFLDIVNFETRDCDEKCQEGPGA